VEFWITTSIPEVCINHLFKNNNGDLVNKITIETEFEADIIICSARFLYDEKCKLKCNQLLVLDSLDLSKSLYGVQPKIDFYVPKDLSPDKVIFLSNPANIMDECRYGQMIYYQKLSKHRLDKLPVYKGRFVADYNLKIPFFRDLFKYRRTSKEYLEVRRGKYFENVGRNIFEHIYFGKEVEYNIDGMFMKDGLYHYLNLFGVNGMHPHKPLPITKEMIKENLIMNDNDPILRLL
jgi:hypothetical protein